MAITTKVERNALVTYDTNIPHRWLDVVGENVVGYSSHFAHVALASADSLAGWTTTLVEGGGGESTVTAGTTEGGTLVITTDAFDNDGVNLQVTGESFRLNSRMPCYFGIRFKIDTAEQADFLVGLCITNTALLGGISDGVYWRKVDGSTDVYFVLEKDSVESASAVDTCVADTYVIYEFYSDGDNISMYVDGTLTSTTACTIAAFPDDEALTPSIQILTGAAAITIATVDWLRCWQIRQ